MAKSNTRVRPLRVTVPRARHRSGRRPMYSAAFYADLPPRPELPDLAQARLYWLGIMRLLDDETKIYTRNERTALRRLREVWRRRAFGDDKRWLLAGTRPGRLERALEAAIRPPKAVGWGEGFSIAPKGAEEEG